MLDSLLLSDPVSDHVPVLLVADDDEDILTLVQLRLSRSGFEVIVARDGDEALRLVQERHPDLAVLDWMMPKASGLEVLRAIRANSETADIPVVLLTARASESDVQEEKPAEKWRDENQREHHPAAQHLLPEIRARTQIAPDAQRESRRSDEAEQDRAKAADERDEFEERVRHIAAEEQQRDERAVGENADEHRAHEPLFIHISTGARGFRPHARRCDPVAEQDEKKGGVNEDEGEDDSGVGHMVL